MATIACPRDEDIDSESLINEVEKRPALFNKSLKDYSDANLKSKLWEEVCLNVLCMTWGQLNTEQKNKQVCAFKSCKRMSRSNCARNIYNICIQITKLI